MIRYVKMDEGKAGYFCFLSAGARSMKAILFAVVPCLVVAATAASDDNSSGSRREQIAAQQQLDEALAAFKLSTPWDALAEAPSFVRRNRGVADYLAGQLRSSSLKQEAKDRIAKDFVALKASEGNLLETASRLERDHGQFYRQILRLDVLRLFVELLSEGKQTCHFAATEFNDAYYSLAEGRGQLFQVVVPPDYSRDQAYPLIVQVGGSRRLLPSQKYKFIRVRPSAGTRPRSRPDATGCGRRSCGSRCRSRRSATAPKAGGRPA